jgi:hypothetical protein
MESLEDISQDRTILACVIEGSLLVVPLSEVIVFNAASIVCCMQSSSSSIEDHVMEGKSCIWVERVA